MALTREEAAPERESAGDRDRGTGSGEYEVKGHRATAEQRRTIDGCLAQASEDSASRRVMQAVIMCITQESLAGKLATTMTGNDDVGIFQQGRNWVSEEDSKDPEASTHAFLITGPTSWKKVHGGVKKAPGNLSQAIHAVQGNKDPMAYDPWEEEASNTVDTWLGEEGNHEGSYTKRYTFTRGEKGGQRENSWDAAKRLVDEVGAYRWAAANVLYAVSGDELRAQRPQIMVRGTEAWLVKHPSWSWSANRAISEITLVATADRWDVLPGARIDLHRDYQAMAGAWMVWNVSGSSLDSPEVTLVLRRPTRLKTEPPAEKADREGGGEGSDDLEGIAKEISEVRANYEWGGGHDKPLSRVKSNEGLDCSGAVSLALYRAKMFDGGNALTSGGFASSWGKPGRGEDFTVWANAGHVFMVGEGEDYWRFDTSQHGGKSGPAYTTTKRSTAGFTPRHWPGH